MLEHKGNYVKKIDSAEKRAGEDEMFGCITDSMNMSLSKLWEIMKDREACHASFHGVKKNQT
jgi:hypothetical protein